MEVACRPAALAMRATPGESAHPPYHPTTRVAVSPFHVPGTAPAPGSLLLQAVHAMPVTVALLFPPWARRTLLEAVLPSLAQPTAKGTMSPLDARAMQATRAPSPRPPVYRFTRAAVAQSPALPTALAPAFL